MLSVPDSSPPALHLLPERHTQGISRGGTDASPADSPRTRVVRRRGSCAGFVPAPAAGCQLAETAPEPPKNFSERTPPRDRHRETVAAVFYLILSTLSYSVLRGIVEVAFGFILLLFVLFHYCSVLFRYCCHVLFGHETFAARPSWQRSILFYCCCRVLFGRETVAA